MHPIWVQRRHTRTHTHEREDVKKIENMAEQVKNQERTNSLREAISRTWEAAMRLKGSVVVNDATLFL